MNQSTFDIQQIVTEVLAELRRIASSQSQPPTASISPASQTLLSQSASASLKPDKVATTGAAGPADVKPADGSAVKKEDGSAQNDGAGARNDGPAAKNSGSAPADGASAELSFEGRVLALDALSGRLTGLRRVLIRPGTIVTPAVHDELQRRGIALEYVAATPALPADALRLVVVNALRGFQAGQLAPVLRSHGVLLEIVEHQCLIAATDQLAAELRKTNTLGLLLTRHVAAALCLANRHAGVRAVTAGDLPTMTAAVESVGANLLVLDAEALTGFQLKQMTTEFAGGKVRPCPEALRPRLA
jgi:hypothetical protein